LDEETIEGTEEESTLELEELDKVFKESGGDLELSIETGQGKDEDLSIELESLDLDLAPEKPDDKQS
ncbi:MAG: hypothetical protein SV775_19695, partial [Thermodesulfobacteriota bacterium]|nr:hypothetical protein [Thermodesulfobacteriota bacterium]